MSQLVVLAGQSNAVVYNLNPAELPAYARMPDPHVQIWTAAGFQTLVAGVNTGGPNTPGTWGPEVSFAHDWVKAHPGETLYLVKSVKGSTGLVAGAAPNWSPEQPPLPDGTANGMFNKTTALMTAAKAASGLPVSEVLWMQGEADATSPAAAAAYQANLTDLFAHMRSDWGADRIVFGEVGDGPGLAYANVVRAAQLAVDVADLRAMMVGPDALALQADQLHLTAESALHLGDEFYAGAAIGELFDNLGLGFAGAPLITWDGI